VQLCAQGLILRDNGYECSHGVVYYASSKTRVAVEFDAALEETTLSLLDRLRAVADSGSIPPPLLQSRKCEGCSLAGICLPDETNLLSTMEEGHQAPQELRRLVPGMSDLQPVYVQEQGAMVSKKGDVLQVKREGAVVQEVRLLSMSQLSIFGNVQVSTQLMRELGDRGIPICYFTYGAWFAGIFSGMGHKNVDLRRAQFALAADEDWSLGQAAEFVSGKIRNARTLLRRNSPEPGKGVLAELSRLASQARKATNSESLLGTEGAAARTYFSRFDSMLKPRLGTDFDFRTRNRRPPADPVNALLSFVYGLLVKDLHLTLLSVGFDPLMGFLHRPRYGKPALALDLAEEFRPLVGDSVVLTLVNGGEVGPQDFIQRGGASALTTYGRRKVIAAYERRLGTEVRHPLFGYSVSYRRVMEVQARLLARRVAGEIREYVPFVTR
jgi:CRISPR-associated protein Cas1